MEKKSRRQRRRKVAILVVRHPYNGWRSAMTSI